MIKRWQIADYIACGALVLVTIASGRIIAVAGRISGAAVAGFVPGAILEPAPAAPTPLAASTSSRPLGSIPKIATTAPAPMPTLAAQKPAVEPAARSATVPAITPEAVTGQLTQPSASTAPSSQPTALVPTNASLRVFSPRLVDKPSDAAVRCGREFASTIWGVVKDKRGHGIARAVVQVSSRDGRNRFTSRTNSRGGFSVPGLGCTTWIVRLVRVPGALEDIESSAIAVRLNGGRYSGAGVDFHEQ